MWHPGSAKTTNTSKKYDQLPMCQQRAYTFSAVAKNRPTLVIPKRVFDFIHKVSMEDSVYFWGQAKRWFWQKWMKKWCVWCISRATATRLGVLSLHSDPRPHDLCNSTRAVPHANHGASCTQARLSTKPRTLEDYGISLCAPAPFFKWNLLEANCHVFPFPSMSFYFLRVCCTSLRKSGSFPEFWG